MTEHIIKTLIGLACAGVFGACVEYIKRSINKQKIMEKAIRALAHDALIRYCRYTLPQDHITESQLENLEYLYKSYNALGLNGTGQRMYEECKNKPLRNDKDY